MRNKKLFNRLMAMTMCSTLTVSTPIMMYATENEVVETNGKTVKGSKVENTSEFEIMNGHLIRYVGEESEVVIPDEVVAIRDGAFRGNSNIKKVIIPEGVTTIGRLAFKDCSNLVEVQIPNSITSIGINAFSGTAYAESDELVIANHFLISGKKVKGEVVIPEGITVIVEGAFSHNAEVTKVTVPEGVTSIGRETFSWCDNLEEVILPSTVTRIVGDGGDWWGAFQECTGLKRIVIPEGVTVIEGDLFSGCENLSDVEIPNSVTSIKDCAFSGCSSLTSITIPNSVTFIGEYVFNECNDVVIYGYTDSYAQTYAQENDIPFVELKKEENPEEKPDDTQKPQENPFNDVSKEEYYYTPVLWALEKGITAGLKENQFAPEQACTRGQVVTFLWRAMGEPEPKTTKNPFVDVSANEYYTKAVLWALENGITSGTDSTHFAPDTTVTRSQFVTFLHRAEGKPSYNTSNPFKDVQKDYYYDAILWAYEKGITTGLNATTFGTEQSCTRGQVVTFLYRGLNEK